MICHYAWQLWTPAVERYRFVSITLAYCILVLWPLAIFIPIPLAGMQWFMPPAVVAAVLVLHSANQRLKSRILIDFGGASYSLYLIHTPVMETLRASSEALPVLTLATPAGAVIAVCFSSALAMIVYYKLEIPILKYLHSRLKNPTRIDASAPVPILDSASR